MIAPIKYFVVMVLFGLVICVAPLKLRELNGVIVLFETINEIDQEMLDLKDEYKEFVTKELENTIVHEYDTLFVGFSIKFTNINSIYYQVGTHLGIKDIDDTDDQAIYDGLYDMLVGFKKDQLKKLGIKLNMSPDNKVDIYDSHT